MDYYCLFFKIEKAEKSHLWRLRCYRLSDWLTLRRCLYQDPSLTTHLLWIFTRRKFSLEVLQDPRYTLPSMIFLKKFHCIQLNKILNTGWQKHANWLFYVELMQVNWPKFAYNLLGGRRGPNLNSDFEYFHTKCPKIAIDIFEKWLRLFFLFLR